MTESWFAASRQTKEPFDPKPEVPYPMLPILLCVQCVVLSESLTLAKLPGPSRVGEIRIVGNEITSRHAILNALDYDLQPGQRMPSEADRLRVEIRLLMRFHKRFDLDAGRRPEILVERNDKSEFWDVEVRFPERDKK